MLIRACIHISDVLNREKLQGFMQQSFLCPFPFSWPLKLCTQMSTNILFLNQFLHQHSFVKQDFPWLSSRLYCAAFCIGFCILHTSSLCWILPELYVWLFIRHFLPVMLPFLVRKSDSSDASGKPELPTTDELIEVLEDVRLAYILSRVGGLDSAREWSSVLSLGEQQRLAFARLLLSKPKLVLLDESTSALDEANEVIDMIH